MGTVMGRATEGNGRRSRITRTSRVVNPRGPHPQLLEAAVDLEEAAGVEQSDGASIQSRLEPDHRPGKGQGAAGWMMRVDDGRSTGPLDVAHGEGLPVEWMDRVVDGDGLHSWNRTMCTVTIWWASRVPSCRTT
jgi:hypothetical protein